MKYRILNNNSLEFFDATANNTGLIAANGVNLKISANNGVIELGDTASDVQVGTVGTAINWTFLGGGTVGAGGTGVIAMGSSGDTVNMNVSGVTYQYPSTLVRYTDITATNNKINITTQVPGTINLSLPNRPVTGQLSLTDNVPSTSNSTGTLTVAGGVGVSGNIWVGGTNAGANGIYTDVLRYAANGLPWVMGSGGGAAGGNVSASGWTVNTLLFANATGFLTTNANISYYDANSTIVTANVKLTGTLTANTGFQLGSAADGVSPIQGTFKWSGPNVSPAWFGIYDSASSRYYGISSSLPGSIASVGGYYSGMGVSGTTSSAGSPIFGVLNNTQSGNGLGNTALTIYGDSKIVTLRNTLDDNRGNANVTGNLTVGNSTSSISSTSNTTGSLIVTGGVGVTGNLFMSTANNFYATTTGSSYRLGWTDNYFYKDERFGGLNYSGGYLNMGSGALIISSLLAVRTFINNDSGNNVVVFAGNSPVLHQNTAAAVSNSTGSLIVNGGIGTSGAIYSTGGSITINNGLATTGNSGTIFLGDSYITKTYGSGWTFTAGLTAPGLTISGSNYIDLPAGSNTIPSIKQVGASGIGMYFPTGPATLAFTANSANALFLTSPAGAANYLQITGNTAAAVGGGSAIISAQGTDTNIGINLLTKGTSGYLDIGSPSYLNTLSVRPGTGGVGLYASGSGNSELAIGSINYNLRFFTSQGTNENLRMTNTPGSVNFIQMSGNTTGNAPTISAGGSDANIGLVLQPKGTGALQAQPTDSTAAGGNARGANAVDWQTQRSAANRVASAQNSFIGGGYSNQANAGWSSVVGGYGNAANGIDAFVGGGENNTASGLDSAVVNGGSNISAGYFNFIGGGWTNSGTSGSTVTTQSGTMNGTTAVTLSGSNASIKVGQLVTGTSIANYTYVAAISGTSLTLSQNASGSSTSTLFFYTPHGVIVGGGNNTANGSYSFVGGGGDAGTASNGNLASGDWSVVVGGRKNTASGIASFVGGGGVYIGNPSATWPNIASGNHSVVVGGLTNTASGESSFVGGGYNNYASSLYSFVGGGNLHTAAGFYSFIGGGGSNIINSLTAYSGIVAGSNNNIQAAGTYGFIGGGANNVVSGAHAVVTGGNTNNSNGQYSVVGGGVANRATVYGTTVSGGDTNSATGYVSATVGGSGNYTNSGYSFAGAGLSNGATGGGAGVVGGYFNTASGYNSFIGGGERNQTAINTAVTTQAANTFSNTAVTLNTSNASIKVGQLVQGTGITTYPNQTYVAAISGTSLTLSQNASSTTATTLSFYTPHNIVVGGGNNLSTGAYSFIGGGGDAGNSANSNRASGDWSVVVGGQNNQATGLGSVVVGGGYNGGTYGSTASGLSTFIGGGVGHNAPGNYASILGGYNNYADSAYSNVFGFRATTRSINSIFVNSIRNSYGGSTGTSQMSLLGLAAQTTDANTTVLTSDSVTTPSTTNQLILPNNAAYYFKGSLIANVTGAAAGAAWSFEGAIMRGSGVGSVVLIGTPTINRIGTTSTASSWSFTLTADTTNGGLAVTVTGQTSTTIRWVCKVETTEVTF